ncbi:hypothetical protein [Streptomyces sp. NPDC097610]|uniref:hypothetical protein n=1 Tax=Streptomyces sp. NPDC097610 TaxID=3157227 RepID=UPI00331D185C
MTQLVDSVHARVPFQAQGAAHAIGDAAVPGDALAGATSTEVPNALVRYALRASTARSDVDELDAALQELTRRSSSPRLPHSWKTA